jgi:hypothetical protein
MVVNVLCWTGVLVGTEGLDDFLRALDVGMLKRSVATKVVEGLNGKLRITIQQVEDSIKFTTFGPNDPDGVTNEFTIGKCDNVNENAFLGKMIADLHWEVSTEGQCALVADMQGEDGKTAQLRRSLIGDVTEQVLLMETIVNETSMRQRYACESRPEQPARTASKQDNAPATRSTGVQPASNDDTIVPYDDQQTIQSSFETCTIHLDYIQSKFPWPLASEYDGLRSWLAYVLTQAAYSSALCVHT